jgi:hypothetical protein
MIVATQQNFKANYGILSLYMKGINPHDEIKGSISNPQKGKIMWRLT